MKGKIREHIDGIFSNAPVNKKTVEIKEEILQNLFEKYNDLISEGKTEEAAFNITIASVGDVSGLIQELNRTSDPAYEQARMEEIRKEKKKSALITSIAVALYIMCVLPVIIFDGEMIALGFMVIMVALATGLLIYNNMTGVFKKNEETTITQEFKEWRTDNANIKKIRAAVSSAIWCLTITFYIILSFWTGAWHISWVIFLIAVSVTCISSAIIDLKYNNNKHK